MDKCPFCGALQDTDQTPLCKYLCCTVVSGGTAPPIYLRSSICYEREIASLRKLVREMGEVLMSLCKWGYNPGESPWKAMDDGAEILSRPGVREIMEEKNDG